MSYMMESAFEVERLERKTGFEAVEQQARWAGLKKGMRVADIGCGSGKTSYFLKQVTGADGEVVGIDFSDERLEYARKTYQTDNLSYVKKNIYEPLEDLGKFDFIWVRFLLEYHKEKQFELVKRFSELLAPGGILCLIDLDHNSINHYGQSDKLEKTMEHCISFLMENTDFDPFAGRRLYSHMYDLGLNDIKVDVGTHHLFFGELSEKDRHNWTKKINIGLKNSGYPFSEYKGGFEEFAEECIAFLDDPRRFTYTPLILCRGAAAR